MAKIFRDVQILLSLYRKFCLLGAKIITMFRYIQINLEQFSMNLAKNHNELIMSGIKERIQIFIKHIGVTTKKFEENCGLSNGYISSMRKGFGTEKLNNVLLKYPELNREWLLYGEGEMLRAVVSQRTVDIKGDASNVNVYNSSLALEKALDNLAEQIELTRNAQNLVLNAQRQADKSQTQIDRLLSILEKYQQHDN